MLETPVKLKAQGAEDDSCKHPRLLHLGFYYSNKKFYMTGRDNFITVTRAGCYKTFYVRNLRMFVISTGKHFQPSLMFLGKPRT